MILNSQAAFSVKQSSPLIPCNSRSLRCKIEWF
nr:MAG TPA: hypothetical protein [Caudoviricetes sp.]